MSGPNTVSTSRDSKRAPVSVCVSVWQVCLGSLCMEIRARMQMCVCYFDFVFLVCVVSIGFWDLTAFSHPVLFFPPPLPPVHLLVSLSPSLLILPQSLCLSLSLARPPPPNCSCGAPLGVSFLFSSHSSNAIFSLSTFDFHWVSCSLHRESLERQG